MVAMVFVMSMMIIAMMVIVMTMMAIMISVMMRSMMVVTTSTLPVNIVKIGLKDLSRCAVISVVNIAIGIKPVESIKPIQLEKYVQ